MAVLTAHDCGIWRQVLLRPYFLRSRIHVRLLMRSFTSFLWSSGTELQMQRWRSMWREDCTDRSSCSADRVCVVSRRMQGLVLKRGQGIIRSKGKKVGRCTTLQKQGWPDDAAAHLPHVAFRTRIGRRGRSDPGESDCGETSETAWNNHLGISQVFSCLLVTF